MGERKTHGLLVCVYVIVYGRYSARYSKCFLRCVANILPLDMYYTEMEKHTHRQTPRVVAAVVIVVDVVVVVVETKRRKMKSKRHYTAQHSETIL